MIQHFLVFSQGCATVTMINFKMFLSSPQKTLYLLAVTLYFSSTAPPALINHNSTFWIKVEWGWRSYKTLRGFAWWYSQYSSHHDFLTLNVLCVTGIQMLFMGTHTGDLLPTHFCAMNKEQWPTFEEHPSSFLAPSFFPLLSLTLTGRPLARGPPKAQTYPYGPKEAHTCLPHQMAGKRAAHNHLAFLLFLLAVLGFSS